MSTELLIQPGGPAVQWFSLCLPRAAPACGGRGVNRVEGWTSDSGRRSRGPGRRRATWRKWHGGRSGSGTGRCGRSSGCSRLSGAKLAPVYRSVLDPMVSLGYLAAATSSIRLGVAVVNHPFQSPLLLAKQAATVDVLSGGRLDLGIGSGWLPEEFTGSGASMAAAGRAGRRLRRRAAGAVERRGRVPGGLLLHPGGPAGPGAGAAARAADPDRRHVTGGDGAGRADRRRVGDRVER